MGAVREEEVEEERIQNLRSKATELLLREEFEAAAKLYTEIISLCSNSAGRRNLQKILCLAHSNRAETLARSSRFAEALLDCDGALQIDASHSKTLICKGKILLNLNRYASAADCFRRAKKNADSSSSPSLDRLLEKCRKLESLSKSGAVDVSGWVAAGFDAKRAPELGEFVGPVEIKFSDLNGRGLFSSKNVDSGTVLLITKAVAVDRVIMPRDSGESSQLVLWKNFVDRVEESVHKCGELNALISTLSAGEQESIPQLPEIDFFKPEATERLDKKPPPLLQKSKLVSILDTNSMLEEDGNSAKVLGRNSSSDHHHHYRSVGLWILPSFINHSCIPNARRTHVGDHVIVHASRDVAAGEELTFAYFDVLAPPSRRRETAGDWGFECRCERCRFEGDSGIPQACEMAVDRLEETMAKSGLNAKEKGMLRASFWEAYERVFTSEWRRRRGNMPAAETVAESVAAVVGCDERMLRVLSSNSNGVEKRLKIGRGIYGKIMKKSALNTLILN